MSSSATTSSVSSTATSTNEDSKQPLWAYTMKFEKVGGGGGNTQWQYNFCTKTFKSSYTRVRAHLLKLSGLGIGACQKVKSNDLMEMQKLEEEAEKRTKQAAPNKVPLPPTTVMSGLYQGFESKKRKVGSGSGSLEKAFNMGTREQMNSLVARAFYSAGLPFHLARNPYFRDMVEFAANNSISGYKCPGYNLLRTTLLVREKSNIDRLLAPCRSMWNEKGVSIVSDGWSDSQRRPLINFIAITDGQPMFIRAVDCSGKRKDAAFIADLLTQVINEIGSEKVVQVITNNANNCKAAGQLIEAKFPNIVWTPCVVHILNLALKNICAAKNVESNEETYSLCMWITEIFGDAVQIKNFIMNHSMVLVIFNDFVPLKLLSVAETRFASVVVMLKRFKLIKGGLQAMVVSDKWSCYRDDDQGKAKFVKEKVMSDEWWDSIDYILSFTAPIYDMLRLCDTDKPCLHLVYDMWDTMIEKVKKAIYAHEKLRDEEFSPFYEVVHEILVSRWDKNNTPLHCLAHSLTPKYYSDEWLHEDPSRVPPQRDEEISNGRVKCFKKYFPNIDERNKVGMEYINFITNAGNFREFDAMTNRYSMEPMAWWLLYGSSAPMLQMIASKILVQPSSSSCAERNWSTYSFVNSARRNRLTPKRGEDLVFIHSNLRLLSRRTPQYTMGETKMWDIAGDSFDTLEAIGELQMASLSLDEPELETVVFEDSIEEGFGGGQAVDVESI